MKKIVSMLLIGVMCCGLFVGCGNKDADKKPDENNKNVNEKKEELPFNVSVESAVSFFKSINDGETIQFTFIGEDNENQTIIDQKSGADIGIVGNKEENIVHAFVNCKGKDDFKTMCSFLCVALKISVDDVKVCFENIGMNDLENLGDTIDDTKFHVSKGIKYQLSHVDGTYSFWIMRDRETSDEYVE